MIRNVRFIGEDGLSDPERIDHELKVWRDQFRGLASGDKCHEFRKNDRDFSIGDLVLLREFEPAGERYIGPELLVRITWISYGPEWGIPKGFCCFSFRKYAGDAWTFEYDENPETRLSRPRV